MKIRIEFTVDVIKENMEILLEDLNITDETVREYVQSYFSSLEDLLEEHVLNNVGLPALTNERK